MDAILSGTERDSTRFTYFETLIISGDKFSWCYANVFFGCQELLVNSDSIKVD